MREWAKWWATIRIAWSKTLAYKLNFLLLVIGPTLVFFFVKYNLWTAIYSLEGITSIQGYSLKEMLHYQIWGLIVGFLVQGYNSMNLAEDIRLGRISAYLIYPFGFWPYQTASFIAFQGIQCVVAAFSFVVLLMSGLLQQWSWATLLSGSLFSLLMGFFWYQVSYLIGLAAFWLEETWVLRVMFMTISQFLSGAIIPLEIYPPWLVSALKWTPFPYLTYAPIKIFMGEYPGSLLEALGIVSSWLLITSFICRLVWIRGIRLYTAAGM